jgi:hypothetical protein
MSLHKLLRLILSNLNCSKQQEVTVTPPDFLRAVHYTTDANVPKQKLRVEGDKLQMWI